MVAGDYLFCPSEAHLFFENGPPGRTFLKKCVPPRPVRLMASWWLVWLILVWLMMMLLWLVLVLVLG